MQKTKKGRCAVTSQKAKAVMKIGLALVVLVVVMLASVGAWEIYKGSVRLVGNAHADGVFDLLKCYSIKADGLASLTRPPKRAVLLDEFIPQGERVLVGPAQLLCTPAKRLLP
jgi:hypothetical protein